MSYRSSAGWFWPDFDSVPFAPKELPASSAAPAGPPAARRDRWAEPAPPPARRRAGLSAGSSGAAAGGRGPGGGEPVPDRAGGRAAILNRAGG